MNNFLYTLAFDPPGSGGTRQMAKMLAGSVMRTFFEGQMVIFRNSSQPLFLIQREGIAECYIDTPPLEHQELANYAMAWKPRARALIPQPEQYDWVVFVDCDSLMLRNVDHLFEGREGVDILYQPEPGRTAGDAVFSAYLTAEDLGAPRVPPAPSDRNAACAAAWEGLRGGAAGTGGAPRRGRKFSPAGAGRFGINSGTWAVRGHCYARVMEEWDRIQQTEPRFPTIWTEQGAWNRVVRDAGKLGLRAEPFEAHEIQFPLHLHKDWEMYKDAAIVHCLGVNNLEKIEFMFGLYMQKFFHDPACTLLGVLDT